MSQPAARPLARLFLERYLEVAPVPLAIVRAEEAALFSQVELHRPVLDIGSGDGLFAAVVFPAKLDVGLDISWRETQMALGRNAYHQHVVAAADAIPFADETFQTVMSNCVFEHIPTFFQSFQEIHRVLKPGGRFIFTAHSDRYDDFLFFPSILGRVGLGWLRDWYLSFVNGVFRHYNCFSPQKWGGFLEQAGFTRYEYRYYLPKQNLNRFDQLLPFSVLGVLNKRLFGRWLHVQKPWLARWAGDFIQPQAEGEVHEGGALFIIAYKE